MHTITVQLHVLVAIVRNPLRPLLLLLLLPRRCDPVPPRPRPDVSGRAPSLKPGQHACAQTICRGVLWRVKGELQVPLPPPPRSPCPRTTSLGQG